MKELIVFIIIKFYCVVLKSFFFKGKRKDFFIGEVRLYGILVFSV